MRGIPGLRIGLPGSNAAIGAWGAEDGSLAKVGAGLHFDQLQRQLARILQPVFGADRDVDRLVLAQQAAFVAELHHRRAMHYHPVLGAMMVPLQAEPRARLDGDSLYLEATAAVDRAVIAPRPMGRHVVVGVGPVARTQSFD